MYMKDRVSRRSLFIDATRGLAMLLVCVSHFGIAYFGPGGNVRGSHLTSLIALPSTATFILLSGILLGFLSVQNAASFPKLSLKLMDRGLFLFGPAHGIIMVAHYVIFGNVRFFFITDAIGFCLLLGPWLVATVSGRTRMALGASLITIAWFGYLNWEPTGSSGWLMRAIFLGDTPFKHGWLTFPVLPWFGSYLLATPLGEKLATWRKAGDGFVARLGAISLLMLGVGLALHLLGRGQSQTVRDLLSGGQKYPPGPAFLLTSAGAGLGGTTLVAWLERRGFFQGVLAAFAMVGRSSLVVFVVQYFVYYVGVFSLHLSVSRLWPATLAITLAIIYGVAFCWDRYIGNDYLTVGLPYLFRGRARVPSTTQS
jgi:uncharacterized membrane protein